MNTKIADQTLRVEQMLQQALAEQQAGRLQEAKQLYRSILQIDPNHPKANHGMGALAVYMQQPATGLPYFIVALNADPTCAQYWLSAIDCLLHTDQLDTAGELLALAKQQGVQRNELDALAVRLEEEGRARKQFTAEYRHENASNSPCSQDINTLLALFNEGRYSEAIPIAQTMTEQFPLYGFGWKALGTLFAQMGRHADALIAMQKAAALSPSDAEAHYNLGNAFKSLDQLNEAETCYRQALTINPNDAEIYYNLGNTLKALGRLDEAGDCYQRALTIKPGDANACYNLGVTYQELGRLDEAAACYRQALATKPNFAEAHSNLGNVLKNLGRFDEAETSYRQALAIKPDFVEAHYNLSGALQEQGRLDEAEASYRRVLAIKADYPEAHCNLGNTLKALGRLDEAEASYRRALKINADYAEAYYNLGGALQELGRLDEAETSYRTALAIKPDFAEAHYNLGGALHEQGRLDEAEASYRRALEIKPNYAQGHNNLGISLHALGRLVEAEASYRQALAIKPDFADAYYSLGCTLQDLGRLNEAETSYRQALTIKPDYADAYNNLGVFMQKCERLDDAVAHFRRALEIKPEYDLAHSNLIFSLDLMLSEDSASLCEERARWSAAHADHLHQQLPFSNIRDPKRCIRIGYVSGDFREHSAPKAFGGMLTCYDRAQFEVFAYSNVKGKDDRFTELFKQNVTAWRNIIDLSDDAVAELIREDRIDILVDLSGYSEGNRLLVFARKPAPIQITAWGYAAGTGMRAMDVFFTDSVLVPMEEQQYYAEEVRYLPNALGAFFVDSFPDVSELPALANRAVTFGSFNRLVKISDKAYSAWTQILLALPMTRLILKTGELDNVAARERVVNHFTKVGIAANRIVMQGTTSWCEHMQTYCQIDIVLDPFPQGGGVTALESLMMGVPIINLRGASVAGRSSASIMTTLGLSDWIAENSEQYAELAIQKASDLQSLATLRQQLRGIFKSSVLGDQTAYARAVEQEYRKLWQEWCSRV